MTQTAKRRVMRIIVYLFLVASAAAAFLLGDWLRAAARQGDVPVWAPLVAPGIFTLFVVVYGVDRWLMVRRRLSSLGRAFIQVAFAMTFVSLLWLWPYQAPRDRDIDAAGQAPDYRVALLADPDPNVRAAACELLGLRADASATARIGALATHDDSLRVRQACGEALRRLEVPVVVDSEPSASAADQRPSADPR